MGTAVKGHLGCKETLFGAVFANTLRETKEIKPVKTDPIIVVVVAVK